MVPHMVFGYGAGSAIRGGNVRGFGHFLANMAGLQQCRTRFGMEYFVREIK